MEVVLRLTAPKSDDVIHYDVSLRLARYSETYLPQHKAIYPKRKMLTRKVFKKMIRQSTVLCSGS